MGIVAYLAKGRGSMGELAESVRGSKVGPRFAEWMVRNEGRLKAESRLRARTADIRDINKGGSSATLPRRRSPKEALKSEPVKPPLTIAQKQQLARDFYLKQGYSPKRIDSHLAGIDFNQPVETVTPPQGTKVVQWQLPGAPQGNYYAFPGTTPQQLGISPIALNTTDGTMVNKIPTAYITNSEVEVLKSTAAAVNDTWSIPGRALATQGKGTQMMSAYSSAFDAMGVSP